jgi:hypothetical protein
MDIRDDHLAVGADFGKIFDPKDFLAMINIPDEALCVLRAHLMLEEFLNLWSAKTTDTEDLYSGVFVSFKTKLVISKNLGMPNDFYIVLDKINDIRNRFSHRKGHSLEGSMVDALKAKVDKLAPTTQTLKCENFSVYMEGRDSLGNAANITHTWDGADNRIRFLIVFVILMLKFTSWVQEAFKARDIPFEIMAIPRHES